MCCNDSPLILSSTGGTVGPQGPQGPIGATGPQGPTGGTGSQGPAGASGVAGDKFSTTSSTSLTISVGSKTLTIGTGLAYVPAQPILISFDGSNYMSGTVTSYNSISGIAVVNITSTTGSGTYTAWSMSLAGTQGPPGATGATGPTGATGSTGATGAIGATGPAGAQGIQGVPGVAGVSSYTYGGYWDSTQTNFSYDPTLVVGGVAYMRLLVSSVQITPSTLTASNFTAPAGTTTYVSNYISVGGSGGAAPSIPTPSGTFLSGTVNPLGSAATGDIYLNKATGIFWYYSSGGAWISAVGSTFTTNWQSLSGFGLLNTGWGASLNISYKQVGTDVIFQGNFFEQLTTPIITNTTITTLPVAYRPIRSQNVLFFNLTTGETILGNVGTSGLLRIFGSITPINMTSVNDGINADNTKYSLI